MIAISKQQKEEWENIVSHLEKSEHLKSTWGRDTDRDKIKIQLMIYRKLLSQAIVLSIEDSWANVEFSINEPIVDLSKNYPNGVLIKSK